MMAFIAHPSVRIKDGEHTYNPVVCQEENCTGRNKGVHMHCPLCTVAEAYQDSVILRAHFRIKHLDKGIDFGGLKVLRCCNHCEIVGTIKGEKRFKGAHWHCYRCRNGFNRRDEAIKHFKTHFRNPHTTFQIQVTQEVNCRQYYDNSAEAHPKAYGGPTVCPDSGLEGVALSTILGQPCQNSNSETLHAVEPKVPYISHELCNVNNGFLVASEEEVDPSQHALDRTQTLVLMDPDRQTGSLIYEEAASIIEEQSGESLEQALQMEKQILELQQQNEALRLEKHIMEKKLRAEIQRLQDQVSTVVQSNLKLSEELKQYRSVENCQQRVNQLVMSLEEQHRNLIQAQLATLTQELLCPAEAVPMNGHMRAAELSVGMDKVAVKEREARDAVEGQMDCYSESLVPVPDCEGVQPGQEEFVAGIDSLESAALVVQTTIAPHDMNEDLSRKRRPKDEPRGDEETKLRRVS
ncbi:uncharacterized protein zgc:193801 [Osmerus eperlanus]|uniref:uncharacterized protein zgc:193801 n=1 Tax=Osmerus eperlanus TaxID=29151 RepID=UPI002E0DCAB6